MTGHNVVLFAGRLIIGMSWKSHCNIRGEGSVVVMCSLVYTPLYRLSLYVQNVHPSVCLCIMCRYECVCVYVCVSV